jgi:hypothetical protein
MNERDKQFFNLILQTLDRVDRWVTRIDPESPHTAVASGSPLTADDRRTDPYQTSYAA